MASVMKRCLECSAMVTLRDPIGPRERCPPCQLIYENKSIRRARQATEAEARRRAALKRDKPVQARSRAAGPASVREGEGGGGAALRPPPTPKGKTSPRRARGG